MAVIKSFANEKLSLAYREYGKLIEKFCRIRLKEAADYTDDCVQETFCIYYKKLLAGEEIEQPKAFLYRTADIMIKRVKAEHFKDAKHMVELDEARDVAAPQTDETSQNLDYDMLKKILLAKLSAEEQKLYIQKYVERKSLKEIGKELNIPPTTVANRTSRLRSKIKELTQNMIEEIEKGGT